MNPLTHEPTYSHTWLSAAIKAYNTIKRTFKNVPDVLVHEGLHDLEGHPEDHVGVHEGQGGQRLGIVVLGGKER
jgi:hypothetical protein